MSNTIRFCTYNMGSDSRDFELLDRYVKKINKAEGVFTPPTEIEYTQAQKKLAEILQDKADIYFFQEYRDNSPLVEALRAKKFTIITKNRNSNRTSIAIAPRFTVEESKFPKGFDFSDFATAIISDKTTNQRIVLTSLHASGFKLSASEEEKNIEARTGDAECQKLITTLANLEPNSLHVIGTDLNASPEKWSNRISIFTEQGYSEVSPEEATAVNPNDAGYEERKIDYFFVKQKTSNIFSSFLGIVSSMVYGKNTPKIQKVESFSTWNTETLESDHKPIVMSMQI